VTYLAVVPTGTHPDASTTWCRRRYWGSRRGRRCAVGRPACRRGP